MMRDFLQAMNWTMLAVIYDDDTYGRGGLQSLTEAVNGRGVCFPVKVSVPTDRRNVSEIEKQLRDQVYRLDQPELPAIRGILIFGSYYLTKVVLEAVRNINNDSSANSTQPPIFLFSEPGTYIEGDFADIAKGSFVVNPPRRRVDGKEANFEKHWRDILQNTTSAQQEAQNNMYFKEMFEQMQECSFASNGTTNQCVGMTNETVSRVFKNNIYTQYAVQAALLSAFAVKKVYAEKCAGGQGPCERFIDTSTTPRSRFIDKVRHTDEPIEFDREFGLFRPFHDPKIIMTFEDDADIRLGPNLPLYEVNNYRYSPTCPNASVPCFVKVGNIRVYIIYYIVLICILSHLTSPIDNKPGLNFKC